MKIKHKRIVCIILSFLALTMFFPAMRVEASSESIRVCYTHVKETTQKVVVTVSGAGILWDGKESIQNGTVEYTLNIGDTKTFRIETTQNGYRLARLIYTYTDENGKVVSEDITAQVDTNGYFTITVKGTDIKLDAEFAKSDSGGGDSGSSGGSGNSGGAGSSSGTGSSGGTGGSGSSAGTGSSSGAGNASQSGTSSSSSAKTGDSSTAGWYLMIMLLAAAAYGILAAKKQKDVYKES